MKKFFAMLIATIAACALVSVFAGCADGGQNPAGGTSGGGNQTSTESGGTSGDSGNHSGKLSETEWVAAITEMYASTNFTYIMNTYEGSVGGGSTLLAKATVTRTDDMYTMTTGGPNANQGYTESSMRYVVKSDGIYLYTGDGVNYDSGVLLEGDDLFLAQAMFAMDYSATSIGGSTYMGYVGDELVVGDLTKLYGAFVYDENEDIYSMDHIIGSVVSGTITIKISNGKVVSHTVVTTSVAQDGSTMTSTLLTTFN